MTTFQMGIVLGVSALLAGIAIVFWIVIDRANRKGAVPQCPACGHPRAAHNGTGCYVRAAENGGTRGCACARPYGEPR